MKTKSAIALIAVTLLWIGSGLRPGKPIDGLDVDSFAQLPTLNGGRLKPIDSLARSSLLMLRGKQTIRTEGKTISASRWMIDMFYNPEAADRLPVFEINDPDVLGTMGISHTGKRHFSFEEIKPSLNLIAMQAQQAGQLKAEERSRYQGALMQLWERLMLYRDLQDKPWVPDIGQGKAFRENNPARFNEQLEKLHRVIEENDKTLGRKTHSEFLFNQSDIFYRCMLLYGIVFLLSVFSWLFKPEWLGSSARILLATAFVLHTVGLVSRMIIQGRPPVTNLYSSAVFVGWSAVLLGIFVERFTRQGIASAIASLIGFITLIIAHHLTGQGDTMEMMRAVLDSNFWLATHVTTITVGYSSAFLAGSLGALYIIRRWVDRSWNEKAAAQLERMTYGVLCFCLFFSFVGTILGGIWADQSWGRFWGWDPKENGALMIVLWSAFVLHARVGTSATRELLMVLAVFGNIITALSWFGVNMLGIGLHSYGWMDKAFVWLALFCVSQLAIITLVFLPPRSKQ